MTEYDKQFWEGFIANAQRKAKMYNEYMQSGGAGITPYTQETITFMYREARFMLYGLLVEMQGEE